MKAFALLPVLFAVAACSTEEPPEQHTQLRKTMQEPLDKARAVEAIQKQTEEDRRRQMDTTGQ